MTTPVGGGIRSLNVTLRQVLDLYACVRPVRYFDGVPAPVRHPEKVDMVLFRENTEDVYSGIEWERAPTAPPKLIEFLRDELGKRVREDSGIGIKPISRPAASGWCARRSSTPSTRAHRRHPGAQGQHHEVHRGRLQGVGLRAGARGVRRRDVTEQELWDEHGGELPEGKILIKDRIADAMFQQVLLRPSEYQVIATTNLNGDYLSDALAAQVGGLGMAPGSNEGDGLALFEATHGTAPKYAGQDKVNPGSLILSGVMLLRWLGWGEAAEAIESALRETIGRSG